MQVQRKVLPVIDQAPFMNSMPNCSRGVQVQRKEVANGTGRISAPFP